MEVMRVKTKPMPVVRCEYAQAEKSLAQLLEESFRLYKQGMDMLRQCSEKIDQVEKQVLILEENGETHEF